MRQRSHLLAGALIFSLAGTGAIAGCSSTEPSGPATVNVILNSNPTGKALEAIANKYEAATGADVTIQVLSEQQMRDKIQLNLQSKSNAMDVFMTIPSREGAMFSQSGYYEPLDTHLAGADASYDAEGFAPAAIAGMKVDGETTAIPLNVEGPVMYYRTDLFEQSGLQVPETIDELMDAVKTLKTDHPDVTPITMRGAPDVLAYTFGPFFHADGLDWTSDGKANFDDPRAVKAIEQYATLAADYGPPGIVNYSFNESDNLFTAGSAAIELEATGELSVLTDPAKSKVAENVGVANIPGGSEGSTPTILSWGLAVSPFSKDTDAAWDFVEWVTNPEHQLEMALAGIAPPRTSVFENADYVAKLRSKAQTDWRAALMYILENGETEVGPVGSKAPAMRKVIGDGVDQAILGQSTPEEAAQAIQSGLEPLLVEPK